VQGKNKGIHSGLRSWPGLSQGGLMAQNSRPTQAKRQRERARQEKQAEKAQKRAQRKQEQENQTPESAEKNAELVVTYDEEGQPEGFDFHDF